MNVKTAMEDFPRFDAAEHLKDEGDIAAYLLPLSVVLEENDGAAFAQALGTVARACGMT